MTSQPTKPKRLRLRFSIRTLAIVITLVCCYAACWGPTKRQGVEDVERHVRSYNNYIEDVPVTSATVCPLVVACDEPIIFSTLGMEFYRPTRIRCYYLWFFGYVAKLPYERDVDAQNAFTPADVRGFIDTWERAWESNEEASDTIHSDRIHGGVI